jgi:tetratricopeptide (TPR) repeat protein
MRVARWAALLSVAAWGGWVALPGAPGWNGPRPEDLRDPAAALERAPEPWQLAEVLLEAGDAPSVEAARAALKLPKEAPVEARYRSLLALFGGDYAGAAAALAEAPGTDGWTSSRRSYLSGLLPAAEGLAEFPSEHFVLRARPEDEFLAIYASRALENAHSRMSEVFRASSSSPVVAEVYPDEKRFSRASTLSPDTLERSGAVGICKFGRLMVLSPQAMPLGYRWLDALAHEYNHLLVNRLSGTLCPLWLHEGVARYYETAWRRAGPFEHAPSAETALADAASSTGTVLIPFSRMEPSMVYLEDQAQVHLAFAEVSDAVDYIVDRFGADKLEELLRAFRTASREQAFSRVLGVSEAELEEAWRDSLADREWKRSPGALSQRIALRAVDEAAWAGPDAQGHLRLGDRLRGQGQAAAALLQYRKALEAEPDNGVALLKLANTHLSLGGEEEAERALRLAVEKNPSYVSPYVALGDLLFDQGRYEDARPLLQEALEINPFHPRVHELLGLIDLDVGQFQPARESLERALRLKPGDAEIAEVLRRMPKGPR